LQLQRSAPGSRQTHEPELPEADELHREKQERKVTGTDILRTALVAGGMSRSQTRERRMRFRLHSVIATGLVLLFATLGFAQDQLPQQTAPPSTEQERSTPPEEATPQAPIQPVMSGPFPVMSQQAQNRARAVFEMFKHAQFNEMWNSLSEGLRKVSGKEERFLAINKKLHESLGPETETVEESFVPYLLAPDTVYSRLSRFEKPRTPLVFTITINQRGQVDAFDIKAIGDRVSEGPFAGYTDSAKLKLPFEGEWLVYNGGRVPFENPYAYDDLQRYAIDFGYVKNGRLFSGAGGIGAKNEDYYCFGQPILAPFDGTVTKAQAYFDDNPPGRPSSDSADGNMIIIRHEEGDTHESVMMNHLKQNSLKVKTGDKVKQGDVVAECGNSGNGPVPHLHFQLFKSMGTPLPAQFTDYMADGKLVEKGEPKKGQFVSNAGSTQSSSIKTGSGKATLSISGPAPTSSSAASPQKPGH
jgi:Peptidase family M23